MEQVAVEESDVETVPCTAPGVIGGWLCSGAQVVEQRCNVFLRLSTYLFANADCRLQKAFKVAIQKIVELLQCILSDFRLALHVVTNQLNMH